MYFKLSLYLFIFAPVVKYIFCLIKGIEFNQSSTFSMMFVMALCTLTICETIEKVHINKKDF